MLYVQSKNSILVSYDLSSWYIGIVLFLTSWNNTVSEICQGSLYFIGHNQMKSTETSMNVVVKLLLLVKRILNMPCHFQLVSTLVDCLWRVFDFLYCTWYLMWLGVSLAAFMGNYLSWCISSDVKVSSIDVDGLAAEEGSSDWLHLPRDRNQGKKFG